MNQRCRFAVDIGNSSIKVAASDPNSDQLRIARISLSEENWASSIQAFTDSIIHADATAIWLIASVNSAAAVVLKDWFATCRIGDSIVHIGREDVPINSSVREPDAVGIDRLLGASMAYRLAGERAAIVIDAGTTITIDLVDAAGTFCGGAILPGLGLQLAALHNATDRLPQVGPPENLANLESPGRDTIAAMQLGVMGGIIGAIERISASFDLPDGPLFLTGGDAARLSTAIARPHQTVPDLPLRGLYELQIGAAVEFSGE